MPHPKTDFEQNSNGMPMTGPMVRVLRKRHFSNQAKKGLRHTVGRKLLTGDHSK